MQLNLTVMACKGSRYTLNLIVRNASQRKLSPHHTQKSNIMITQTLNVNVKVNYVLYLWIVMLSDGIFIYHDLFWYIDEDGAPFYTQLGVAGTTEEIRKMLRDRFHLI